LPDLQWGVEESWGDGGGSIGRPPLRPPPPYRYENGILVAHHAPVRNFQIPRRSRAVSIKPDPAIEQVKSEPEEDDCSVRLKEDHKDTITTNEMKKKDGLGPEGGEKKNVGGDVRANLEELEDVESTNKGKAKGGSDANPFETRTSLVNPPTNTIIHTPNQLGVSRLDLILGWISRLDRHRAGTNGRRHRYERQT